MNASGSHTFGHVLALGTNVPREAGVVRGETSCDSPVSVPGEPVPDGSRVLTFMSSCVPAGCTL